jgi:multiple sugar transport system substrate-binding protein
LLFELLVYTLYTGSIAAVLLLFGCDKGLTPARSKVAIRLWVSPQVPELGDYGRYADLRKRFMEENPTIDVQVEVIPWTRRMQKMITADAGDRAPDAAYIGLDFVPRFVQLGMIQPVDNFMTEKERTDYDPTALQAATQDGKLWLYPIDRSVVSGIYNKDLFAKAGLDPQQPPRTWEELEVAARKITADTDGDGQLDQWGLGFILGGDTLNMTFWPLLWQAGGDVISADGKHATFGGPEGLAALNMVSGLFKDGCIPHSYLAFGANEFASGKLGYWWGLAPVQFVQLRKDAPQLHIGVAPVLKNKTQVSYSTVGSFCIFASSRHPAETAKWLSFLTRPENMRTHCRSIFRLPVKRSVGPLYADDPDLAEFERQGQYCRTDVKSIYARQVMGVLIPEIQASVLGKKSPREALRVATEAADKLLAGDTR